MDTDLVDTELDEKTEFSLEELSDSAKEKAREHARAYLLDHDWWECQYDQFVELVQKFGFLVNAKNIQFSGFCSQDDGASFTGSWYQNEVNSTSLEGVRTEYPQDAELASLADRMTLLLVISSLNLTPLLPDSIPVFRFNGRHCYSGTMELGEGSWPNEQDDGTSTTSILDELLDIARELADWLYGQLEEAHDYLLSDEAVDEHLAETRFDENGYGDVI